ncbi:hypothetical protein ACP4OV_001528 [Aristida adscensionis]
MLQLLVSRWPVRCLAATFNTFMGGTPEAPPSRPSPPRMPLWKTPYFLRVHEKQVWERVFCHRGLGQFWETLGPEIGVINYFEMV